MNHYFALFLDLIGTLAPLLNVLLVYAQPVIALCLPYFGSLTPRIQLESFTKSCMCILQSNICQIIAGDTTWCV